MISNALKIILRGFLFGVGFCVASAGAYYLIWHFYMSRAIESYSAGFEGAHAVVGIKQLLLSDVEEQKHDGITAIIGSVKNTGTAPAHGVQLQANLFNHGKFVDQYSTYLSGTLGAGESQYFKILCGCKDSPPAEHDSFKVEVVRGY